MKYIEYKDLLAIPPEKRVQESSGDLLHDKIAGILIAYSKLYDIREKWIDIITIGDAEKEIIELINEYK